MSVVDTSPKPIQLASAPAALLAVDGAALSRAELEANFIALQRVVALKRRRAYYREFSLEVDRLVLAEIKRSHVPNVMSIMDQIFGGGSMMQMMGGGGKSLPSSSATKRDEALAKALEDAYQRLVAYKDVSHGGAEDGDADAMATLHTAWRVEHSRHTTATLRKLLQNVTCLVSYTNTIAFLLDPTRGAADPNDDRLTLATTTFVGDDTAETTGNKSLYALAAAQYGFSPCLDMTAEEEAKTKYSADVRKIKALFVAAGAKYEGSYAEEVAAAKKKRAEEQCEEDEECEEEWEDCEGDEEEWEDCDE